MKTTTTIIFSLLFITSCGLQLSELKEPSLAISSQGFNFEAGKYKVLISSNDGKCTNKIASWIVDIIADNVKEVEFTYSPSGWTKTDVGGGGFASFIDFDGKTISLDKLTPSASSIKYTSQKSFLKNECASIESTMTQNFDLRIAALGIGWENENFSSSTYSADLQNVNGDPTDLATEFTDIHYSLGGVSLPFTNPQLLTGGVDFPLDTQLTEVISVKLTANSLGVFDPVASVLKPIPPEFIGQTITWIKNIYFGSAPEERSYLTYNPTSMNKTLYCISSDNLIDIHHGTPYPVGVHISSVDLWYEKVGEPSTRVTKNIPVTASGTQYSVSVCDYFGNGKIHVGTMVHFSNGALDQEDNYVQWY
mgnify:FL=1